jgi:serine/threonine protein kinase
MSENSDFSRSGRYKILSVLGEGGMGEVFLARDLELNREVAIKTIRRQVAAKEGIRKRTMREARLLSRLRHPSLVPVYEMNMDVKLPYIVQGYVRGVNLREKINEGRLLSEKDAWRLFREQASVLSYIHEQGLFHRDIKPANIMIDSSGNSILMDFGLALDENQTRLTADGKFIGTIQFSSPEVLLGAPSSAAADIFQLGITVYEAFTGDFYLGNFDNVSDFARVLTDGKWNRKDLSSNVPTELAAVITHCCRFSREDRIQNGTDLVNLLNSHSREALETGTAIAPSDSPSRAMRSDASLSMPVVSSHSDLSADLPLLSQVLKSRTPFIVLIVLLFFMGASFFTFWPSEGSKSTAPSKTDLFGGWKAAYSFQPTSSLVKNRTCRLNVMSEGRCIGSKDITFPPSSFIEPFRAIFSYDRIYLKWKLHGKGEVSVTVSPSQAVDDDKNLTCEAKVTDKDEHSFVNYPQWIGKQLSCRLGLPSGMTKIVSVYGGFTMEKKDELLPGVDSDENIQDALTIGNMLYITTRRGWFSALSFDDTLKHLYALQLSEFYNKNQKNVKDRISSEHCVPRAISPSKNGVALWGAGNGKSIIYVRKDGSVSVKHIASPCSALYFDTIQSSSETETMVSALGTDGKYYLLIHNIENERVQLFEQPVSGPRPTIIFSLGGSFFCWYGSDGQNDFIYEVVLREGKMTFAPIAAITGNKKDEYRVPHSLADGDMPRPRFSYTKAVVDKEKLIAVLSNGIGIYSLRKKEGKFKFLKINPPMDDLSGIEGIGSAGDGKFVAVVPRSYDKGKPLSGLVRKLGFLYIGFDDEREETELKIVNTSISVHKLKKNCFVRGPLVRDGHIFFCLTSDFYAMNLSEENAVFSSVFYSIPDRIVILKDTMMVFMDHRFLAASLYLGPPRH